MISLEDELLPPASARTTSLRIGYAVLPPSLLTHAEATLSIAGPSVGLLDQAVLHDFIADGHFARHVRRMRQVYGERRNALTEACQTQMAGVLEVAAAEAGLQALARFLTPASALVVAARAAHLGLDVMPLARYAHRSPVGEGLVLGFGGIEPPAIRRGVSLLRRAILGRRGLS